MNSLHKIYTYMEKNFVVKIILFFYSKRRTDSNNIDFYYNL